MPMLRKYARRGIPSNFRQKIYPKLLGITLSEEVYIIIIKNRVKKNMIQN